MAEDLFIKGGVVYDGTGSLPRNLDIVVRDDRIQALLEGGSSAYSGKVLDVTGLSVCPGFIDTHAHSEFTLLADPRAEAKIMQGVTTEINGNCGLSGGPLIGAYADRREADLTELDISERWQTMEEYLDILASRGPALNFATLVGHGNIRAAVMGYEDRPAGPDEINAMCAMVAEAHLQGVCGLSTGLIYPPGVYASVDELGILAREAGKHGGLYASHMRSEGEGLIEAVSETLRIGELGRLPVHISHLKTAGRENWDKLDKVLSLIDEASGKGQLVTCDRYPYLASSTDLDTVLPSWTFEGGSEKELERLREQTQLERIRAEMAIYLNDSAFWENIRISTVARDENRWMEGLDMAEVSRRLGMQPFDSLIHLLINEKLRVSAIFFGMSKENLIRILETKYTMVGSDASARCFDGITARGRPHPRAFGTFPRFLSRYADSGGTLTFGEAVRRVSGFPATVFGLKDRGFIRPGAFADMVIIDKERLLDLATYEKPFTPPEGIVHVFVNGVQVVREQTVSGDRPGRILKGGG